MKKVSTLLLSGLFMFLVSCQKEDAPASTNAAASNLTIGEMMQSSNSSAAVSMNSGGPSNPLAFARSRERFSVLTSALARTGLMNTLMKLEGEYTLFAPTDAAFAAAGLSVADVAKLPTNVLTSILLYHVIGGEIKAAQVPSYVEAPTLNGTGLFVRKTSAGVFVNQARVTIADVDARNGVTHVIDKVLMPPTKSIVDVVVSDARFTTLRDAVVKAGLVGALSGDGPFTLFAPTNAGFAGIDLATLNNPRLTQVLGYHVVAGNAFVTSNQLVAGSVPMWLGGNTMVSFSGGHAFIKGTLNANPSKIIEADIITTNGVIHVIDRVLLPTP